MRRSTAEITPSERRRTPKPTGRWLSYALVFALSVICTGSLPAADTWSTPAPGIERLHRATVDPQRDINVLIVDLTHPQIDILPILKNNSTEADSGQTVANMAAAHADAGVVAAINADYFGWTDHKPEGSFVIDGINLYPLLWLDRGLWAPTRSSIAFDWDGKPTINRWTEPGPVVESRHVVSGGPVFLWQGVYNWNALGDTFATNFEHSVRSLTLLGISQDGNTLYMMTVDETSGNQDMKPMDAVPLLVELGAWNAMRLDSGGSTTMWLNGTTLHPIGAAHRRVANALAITSSWTRDFGSLRVMISPQVAVSAGAQWRRVGITEWRDSGFTETNVPTGEYAIEFRPVTGWTRTSSQSVTVNNNQTTNISATYVEGNLWTPWRDDFPGNTLNQSPPEPHWSPASWGSGAVMVGGGGYLRLVGTSGEPSWANIKNSGYPLYDDFRISTRMHLVNASSTTGGESRAEIRFRANSHGIGYSLSFNTNDSPNTINLRRSDTWALIQSKQVNYPLPSGTTFHVTIECKGTRIQIKVGTIDGGSDVVDWDFHDTTFTGKGCFWLMNFRMMDLRFAYFDCDYATPDHGALNVTISPQDAVDVGARWRRAGTTDWRDSGSTEFDILAGNHTIEFYDISGWTKPADQEVAIVSGQTTTAGETYVQDSPPIRIPQALTMQDGEHVRIADRMVTAGTMEIGGGFYIQEADRSAGLRVSSPTSVSRGSLVTVQGIMSREATGERNLTADSVVVTQTGLDTPPPLFLAQRELGGMGFSAHTPGV